MPGDRSEDWRWYWGSFWSGWHISWGRETAVSAIMSIPAVVSGTSRKDHGELKFGEVDTSLMLPNRNANCTIELAPCRAGQTRPKKESKSMQAQIKEISIRRPQSRTGIEQYSTLNPRRVLWTGVVALPILLLTLPAFAKPDSLAPLAEKISPSVVNITTSTVVAGRTGPQGIVPEGSPFEDFFRDFQERNQDGDRPRKSSALGSGFVISEDGYVVTNNHVIDGADEILIEFFSGEELKATLIGTDPNTDIALLKVESDEPLPFVSFGNSDDSRVGDWVIAMGNPLGQGFSVSAGIVSARNRALSGTYDDYIQTDAAINRGNSGGASVQHGRRRNWREHGDSVTQWRLNWHRVFDGLQCGDACGRSAQGIR